VKNRTSTAQNSVAFKFQPISIAIAKLALIRNLLFTNQKQETRLSLIKRATHFVQRQWPRKNTSLHICVTT